MIKKRIVKNLLLLFIFFLYQIFGITFSVLVLLVIYILYPHFFNFYLNYSGVIMSLLVNFTVIECINRFSILIESNLTRY